MSSVEQSMINNPSTVEETSRHSDIAQALLGRGGDSNGETNKERREQVRHLEKEAFQLANYYFVFQGVIFNAFYNTPSHLKCEYRWIPFALSFLAGFLNLSALLTIVLRYKRTLDDIDKHAIMGARRDHAPRPTAGSARNGDADPIAVTSARFWRLVYALGCMSVVFAFFAITLVGCWVITCGAGA